MIVLAKYKLLQKLMGLDPRGGLENVILRFLYFFVFILCLLSLLIFLFSKAYDDIYRLWAVLLPIMATTSLMASYLYLVIYRGRFYSLLDDLQDIVNESAKLFHEIS